MCVRLRIVGEEIYAHVTEISRFQNNTAIISAMANAKCIFSLKGEEEGKEKKRKERGTLAEWSLSTGYGEMKFFS